MLILIYDADLSLDPRLFTSLAIGDPYIRSNEVEMDLGLFKCRRSELRFKKIQSQTLQVVRDPDL